MSSAAVVSLLVLAGCSDAEPPAAQAEPTAAADAAAPPTDAGEPSAGTLCAEFPPRESVLPADELEGWWNATPADPQTGEPLLDPAEWADPRLREHPRVAVVDTQSSYWVTWDRTICGESDEFSPTIADDWPALSYAVVDMDTGELLESVDKAAVGDGSGLMTTTSVLASVRTNGWEVLGPEEAARYAELVRDGDPDLGLELVSGAEIMPGALGGVYESASGVGFTFRVQRGEDLGYGAPVGVEPQPLEIDGAEGWTTGGPAWGFTADALTPTCSVAVVAMPVDTDVPPWPDGYDDYLATTVLPRLLTTC